MAKTQERGIMHVKDVFSRGEMPKVKLKSHVQPTERSKVYKALEPARPRDNVTTNVKAENAKNKVSDKTSWTPVDASGYGATRTFGHKKQATPAPPALNGVPAERGRQSGNNLKNGGRETAGSSTAAKQPAQRDGKVTSVANGAHTHAKETTHTGGRPQLPQTPSASPPGPKPGGTSGGGGSRTSPSFLNTQSPSKVKSSSSSSSAAAPSGVASGVEHRKNNKYHKSHVNVSVNGLMNLQNRFAPKTPRRNAGSPTASPATSPTTTTSPTQKDAGKASGGAVYSAHHLGVKKQVQGGGLSRSDSETGSSGYHSEPPDTPRGLNGTGPRYSHGSDSDFAEDECTLSFGDEDDARVAQGKKTKLYKEYDGESFAQYLKDDTCDFEYPTQRRNYRRNKTVSPPLSPNTLERQKQRDKAGLKDKLSSVFTLSKSDAKRRYLKNVRNASTSIHNYTFSDTKMGGTLDKADSNSVNLAEVQSDIGGYASSPGSWWSGRDTLSARSLISRSELNAWSSRSAGDLRSNHYSTMPETQSKKRHSEATLERKKKGNLFQKLTGTLRRKKGQKLSAEPAVEDTRL